MAINTPDHFFKTEQTATDPTYTKMVKYTKEIGKTICITERAEKSSLMAPHMKACL